MLSLKRVAIGFLWCWWWGHGQLASGIYKHQNYNVPCYPPFTLNVTASSRIGCAIFCSQRGCAFFDFQDSLCSMGLLGTFPIESGITNDLYGKFDFPPVVETPLTVTGFPAYSVKIWTDPGDQSAGLAVDGDETSPSYFHSDPGLPNPWWVLDLQADYVVGKVIVQPNTGHRQLFKSMEVRISNSFDTSLYSDTYTDFSSWDLVGTFYVGPPTSSGPVTFTCGVGMNGRYISIQRLHTSSAPYFAISEVRVTIYN